MKRFVPHVILAVFALAPAAAWADDLDVTMNVVPANASPGAATSEIALPDAASERAQKASAFGLGVANEARNGDLFGRDFGQKVSEDARTKLPIGPNQPPQSRRP